MTTPKSKESRGNGSCQSIIRLAQRCLSRSTSLAMALEMEWKPSCGQQHSSETILAVPAMSMSMPLPQSKPPPLSSCLLRMVKLLSQLYRSRMHKQTESSGVSHSACSFREQQLPLAMTSLAMLNSFERYSKKSSDKWVHHVQDRLEESSP